MLHMPALPRRLAKYRSEVLSMGSINFSDNLDPGDMTDSSGVSARRWPYISTRNRRDPYEPTHRASSVYCWDGHFVFVEGTQLYYDGTPIDNVSEGEKQFAVVNSKLIVWPDKLYIDITKGTSGHLDAEQTAVQPVLTETELRADILPAVKDRVSTIRYRGNAQGINFVLYTYGNDTEAIGWTQGGGWTTPAKQVSGFFGTGNGAARGVAVGDIFIPQIVGTSFREVSTLMPKEGLPDESQQNNEGYFAQFTRFVFNDVEAGSGASSKVELEYSVYKVGVENALFTDRFEVGDAVSITGTYGKYNDIDKTPIKEIRFSPNTLVFGAGTFRFPEYTSKALETDYVPGEYALKITGEQFDRFTATKGIRAGYYLFAHAAPDPRIVVWDPEEKKIVEECGYTQVGSYAGAVIQGYAMQPEAGPLTIVREVPAMDYICESGNRLWGCSNKDRTVYASALGLPGRFFAYEGLSTDSWSVAVGSEGDFTGCCKHGANVMFFKEAKLHKVMGSFPAEYTMYDYEVEGLRAGCYRSLQVINEVLYYMGLHGVYAYTGGAPVPLSPNFGNRDFTRAVGGTDGDSYYLSVKEGDKSHLFVFEVNPRIWVREGDGYWLGFARIGRTLYGLREDGTMWELTTGKDDPDLEWRVRFAPMYESLRGRKIYGKMVIRLHLPKGSICRALVRRDHGAWDQVAKVLGSTSNAVPVVIPRKRCDRFEVELQGKGPCAILGMMRQFRLGSDV